MHCARGQRHRVRHCSRSAVAPRAAYDRAAVRAPRFGSRRRALRRHCDDGRAVHKVKDTASGTGGMRRARAYERTERGTLDRSHPVTLVELVSRDEARVLVGEMFGKTLD